ncbi:hypothetical protein B0H13DRAFT_2332332 [Mycena leptocephala]|nr:hypothetical protein B0H13DRAFT_2332332 [Mycena leptocephala]
MHAFLSLVVPTVSLTNTSIPQIPYFHTIPLQPSSWQELAHSHTYMPLILLASALGWFFSSSPEGGYWSRRATPFNYSMSDYGYDPLLVGATEHPLFQRRPQFHSTADSQFLPAGILWPNSEFNPDAPPIHGPLKPPPPIPGNGIGMQHFPLLYDAKDGLFLCTECPYGSHPGDLTMHADRPSQSTLLIMGGWILDYSHSSLGGTTHHGTREYLQNG